MSVPLPFSTFMNKLSQIFSLHDQFICICPAKVTARPKNLAIISLAGKFQANQTLLNAKQ